MNIVLSLLAAAAAGTSDFAGGVASRRIVAIWVTALGHLVGVAVTGLFLLGIDGIFLWSDAAWGAAAGIAGAAGLLSIYAGYAKARVSIAAPVAGVGTAALPVVVDAARGTSVGWVAAAGIAIGLASIALISLGPSSGGGGVASSVAYGLGGAIGLGVLLVLLAEGSSDGGLWPLLAARTGGFAALMAVVALVARTPPTAEGFRSAWPLVIAVGVLGTSANAMFIAASRSGSTTVAAVLVSLFPAVTVIWARAIYKERLRRVQWGGLALALVAIGLIAAG